MIYPDKWQSTCNLVRAFNRPVFTEINELRWGGGVTTMKTHRVWIEIVILATTIAFGLALLIATLGTAAGTAVGALGARSTRAFVTAGAA